MEAAKKEVPSNYDLQVDIGRKIFLEYDQERLIRKFSLQSDESWIYLTYMNIPCRLHRATGRIDEMAAAQWIECRNFSTVMTIYDLLCYHKGDNAPGLFHQWCTVGTFVVTGVTDTGTFTKKAAARFDGHLEEFMNAKSGNMKNRSAFWVRTFFALFLFMSVLYLDQTDSRVFEGKTKNQIIKCLNWSAEGKLIDFISNLW